MKVAQMAITTGGILAGSICKKSQYLKDELIKIGITPNANVLSNTVFFKRPNEEIVRKYRLAQGYDENFGGELAHVVVMQSTHKSKIDSFINDMKKSANFS